MKKASILPLGLSLLITSPVFSQTYDLAFKGKLPSGLQTKTTTVTSFSMTMAMDMGQGPVNMSTDGDGKAVEELHVKTADSLSLKTLEDEMVVAINMPGLGPQEQVQPKPLNGTTLGGSLADGKWTFEITEGKAPKAAVEAKAESFNQRYSDDSAMFGNEERAVGDSWKIDASDLPGYGEFTEFTGTGEGKFLAIEKKGGAECAKVQLTFTGNVDGGKLLRGDKIEIQGKAIIWRDLELKINRESRFEAKIEASDRMEMSAPFKVTEKTEVIATGS